MNKIRLTRETLKTNIRLRTGTLPGALTRNAIKFSDLFQNLIYETSGAFEDRVYKRLENLGWIEYRGLPIITRNGYQEL